MTPSNDHEVILLLGRLEGKVDTLISQQTQLSGRLETHDQRIGTLEQRTATIEANRATAADSWSRLMAFGAVLIASVPYLKALLK